MCYDVHRPHRPLPHTRQQLQAQVPIGVATQHDFGEVVVPGGGALGPVGGVAGHLGVGLGQQLAVARLVVAEQLVPRADAARRVRVAVTVLGELHDPTEALAQGPLDALVGAARDLGPGELLVGDQVILLEAVPMTTKRLGVEKCGTTNTYEGQKKNNQTLTQKSNLQTTNSELSHPRTWLGLVLLRTIGNLV